MHLCKQFSLPDFKGLFGRKNSLPVSCFIFLDISAVMPWVGMSDISGFFLFVYLSVLFCFP